MCGIVGLYLKKKKLHNKLGFYLSGMLDNMSSRGPDSAGFAIYNNKLSKKYYKYSLCLNSTLSSEFEQVVQQKFKDITIKNISDHIVVQTSTTPKKFTRLSNPCFRVKEFSLSNSFFDLLSPPIINN